MPRKQSIFVNIGDRFGRLVIVETGIKHLDKNGHNIQFCRVRCDCGREVETRKKNITHGISRSCGCLHDELVTARNYRHGGSHRPLYNIWIHLRMRCNNPNDKRYSDYGGRGIAVCQEWDTSFPAFRDWALAHGYKEGLSIERVDVNTGYTPSNCCFIPMGLQAKNTRKNVRITCFGETKTATEWSRDPRCIVRLGTLTRRMRVGWAPRDALTLPASNRNRPLPTSPTVLSPHQPDGGYSAG